MADDSAEELVRRLQRVRSHVAGRTDVEGVSAKPLDGSKAHGVDRGFRDRQPGQGQPGADGATGQSEQGLVRRPWRSRGSRDRGLRCWSTGPRGRGVRTEVAPISWTVCGLVDLRVGFCRFAGWLRRSWGSGIPEPNVV